MVETILDVSQTILAVLLVVSILLQAKGDGLGSAFGGTGAIISKRRGPEKVIFISTIIFATLFIGVAVARFFI
jgi:preprotein translocase subunit SecG